MWPFKSSKPKQSEYERGKAAAADFLATNPSQKDLIANYNYADYDNSLSNGGDRFAKGWMDNITMHIDDDENLARP